MDAVESARRVAAELHRQCATLVDPTNPHLFALEAARQCSFDVNEVPVGSSHLDGGRAKLLARHQLIVHEAATTEFEKAFLIAHEIGHAKCGDAGEDDVATVVEPTRSAEQARCAAEQIVDYGRRQRREVQMDLFAREFLLPRKLVRLLHTEKGLSASEIATRFQAPFAVVAQQLFDALLLPSDLQPKEEKLKLPEENPKQKTAAEHLGVPLLLEAGPGTGKTRTLVERVNFLLTRGVDPRKILVLTFSNKAALELTDRISARNKDAAVAMWIGTFHAFGLDIVRRFHAKLGYEKDPRLRNRTEAVELLEGEFARLKLTHFKDLYDPITQIADILSAISRAKDEVIDFQAYAALAKAMAAKATTDEEKLFAARACDVGIAFEAYEALKKRANCLDFGDLVFLPVKLLEGDQAIRNSLKERYEHVLVDEYQDVNRSSVRLLTALTDNGKNLWVVGDPRQSIYRFRGASSFNVTRFGKEDFPGGVRTELELNYRSTPEIVTAFSTFASTMVVGAPKQPFSAYRKSMGGTLELRVCDTPEVQVPLVADSIEELRSKGVPYNAQAVLCSGNDALADTGERLERLGIPVVFLGSLFEREEVRYLLSLISLLCDRRAPSLVLVGADKRSAMPISDVATIIDYLRENEKAPMQWANDTNLAEKLSPEGRAAAQRLGKTLAGFSSASQPWDVLAAYILDRTRIASEIAQSDDPMIKARAIAIWQFLNFIRVQPAGAGEPVPRLLLRIRRLIQLGDDTDLREPPACAHALDAVRLLTMHKSKGLEFPAVHLVGMHESVFPRWFEKPTCLAPDGMFAGAEHSSLKALERDYKEERECLFYVGISRARDHLRLYASAKNRAGSKQKTSSFVDRLGGSIIKMILGSGRIFPALTEDAPVAITLQEPVSFPGYQLTQFSKCPRSFFYSAILRTGGKKTQTPFLLMHGAVRNAVMTMLERECDDLGELLDKEFSANGLAVNGYVSDYRAFALPMLEYLRDIRAGKKSMKVDPLVLHLGSETVTVNPHELVEETNGKQTLRSIHTGSQRSKSHDTLEAATLVITAAERFPGAEVELVFLNDRQRLPISFSDKVRSNRSDTMREIFGQLRAGRFEKNPGDGCARCSAFFFCGPLPPGELVRKV